MPNRVSVLKETVGKNVTGFCFIIFFKAKGFDKSGQNYRLSRETVMDDYTMIPFTSRYVPIAGSSPYSINKHKPCDPAKKIDYKV